MNKRTILNNYVTHQTSSNGVTLIALIITIIVLIILAGTAVSIGINGGDLFKKTSIASQEWNNAVQTEETKINELFSVLNQVTQEPLTIPKTLEVGDIVNWTPQGQYEWKQEYYTDSTNSGSPEYATKMLYSGDDLPNNMATNWSQSVNNLDMTISRWKVMSKDDVNKIVKLVPENSKDVKVKLSGAQGYNNGVKLLNDACSALYGNSKGVTARSICIEDLEGPEGNGTNGLMSANPNIISEAKGNDYPIRVGSAYSLANSQYPKIYEEEALRKIDGVESTDGIGKSQPAAITADENGFISKSNRKVNTKSIQPVKSLYILRYDNFSTALGSNASLILNDGDNTKSFWIASRSISFDYGFCRWGLWQCSYRRFIAGNYVYF